MTREDKLKVLMRNEKIIAIGIVIIITSSAAAAAAARCPVE